MDKENNQFLAEELEAINKADDLKIAPFREDGITYGTPTWIWNVVVNGNLYVRAYNGVNSRWHKSAVKQKAGRIYASGMIKEVNFETIGGDINTEIDEAYKVKYNGSPYLSTMISKQAKLATIKITPSI